MFRQYRYFGYLKTTGIALLINLFHSGIYGQEMVIPNAREIKIDPQPFMLLPPELNENSGIIYDRGIFWTFNDSGRPNILYGVDRQGTIRSEITLSNGKNIDWEDIAQDERYYYIADTGNNRGNRRDLAIYKVAKSEIAIEGTQSVNAAIITFEYEDRTDFSVATHAHSFDCEALITLGDSLYLFTKDWVNGLTTTYSLPKAAGNYIARNRGSFDARGLITGADISIDGRYLALIGYNQFRPFGWIFSDFEPGNFFSANRIYLDMSSIFMAQTEGIVFLSNDSIIISCERTPLVREQLFLLPPVISE
jgi:hypothetical protein